MFRSSLSEVCFSSAFPERSRHSNRPKNSAPRSVGLPRRLHRELLRRGARHQGRLDVPGQQRDEAVAGLPDGGQRNCRAAGRPTTRHRRQRSPAGSIPGLLHRSRRQGRCGRTRARSAQPVRQACTLNDMLAHCSWIKPESPEILLCLQANSAHRRRPAAQQSDQRSPRPRRRQRRRSRPIPRSPRKQRPPRLPRMDDRV